jgi:hypothetical protein
VLAAFGCFCPEFDTRLHGGVAADGGDDAHVALPPIEHYCASDDSGDAFDIVSFLASRRFAAVFMYFWMWDTVSVPGKQNVFFVLFVYVFLFFSHGSLSAHTTHLFFIITQLHYFSLERFVDTLRVHAPTTPLIALTDDAHSEREYRVGLAMQKHASLRTTGTYHSYFDPVSHLIATVSF